MAPISGNDFARKLCRLHIATCNMSPDKIWHKVGNNPKAKKFQLKKSSTYLYLYLCKTRQRKLLNFFQYFCLNIHNDTVSKTKTQSPVFIMGLHTRFKRSKAKDSNFSCVID